jgi:hypothetical protein
MPYKHTTTKWMIMRGMKCLFIAIITMLTFAVQAQEKENSIKKAASEKALAYTAKMMNTLNLTKEQAAHVYRLRYELSISLQLIHLQYADDKALMMQFVEDTQKDFQLGIRKILKSDQIALLNRYKKDFVAGKQVGGPQESLPQTANYEW